MVFGKQGSESKEAPLAKMSRPFCVPASALLSKYKKHRWKWKRVTAMVDGRWMDDHRCLRLLCALCPHNAEPSVTLRANAANAAGPLMMFHSVPAVGGLTQHLIPSVLAPSYDADGKSLDESSKIGVMD